MTNPTKEQKTKMLQDAAREIETTIRTQLNLIAAAWGNRTADEIARDLADLR